MYRMYIKTFLMQIPILLKEKITCPNKFSAKINLIG